MAKQAGTSRRTFERQERIGRFSSHLWVAMMHGLIKAGEADAMIAAGRGKLLWQWMAKNRRARVEHTLGRRWRVFEGVEP
jgi:hypothetical protein